MLISKLHRKMENITPYFYSARYIEIDFLLIEALRTTPVRVLLINLSPGQEKCDLNVATSYCKNSNKKKQEI